MRCSSGLFLAGERSAQLVLGGQRHFGFRQRGIGRIALLAQGFLRSGQGGDAGLPIALARFQAGGLRGQPLAFARAFRLLRGQAVDLIDDGLDFLQEEAGRILQGVEFALAGGDGHFPGAQFGLGLLQAGLQLGLLAEQRAFAPADFGDVLLQGSRRAVQVGDLVFAAEDGSGRRAGTVAV